MRAQHGGPARFRRARAHGQARDRQASLPRVAGRAPRRREASSRSSSCATGSRSGTDVSSPSPPTSARRSSAVSCFGASATAASACRSFPSTSGAARFETSAAASWPTTASPSAVRIAPAGSSAARRGSSAPTRRTRPRRSPSCSRTSSRDELTHRDEATAAAVEDLLAERDARAVLYPGWTSIDELERAAGEKLGRPRVKLRTWDELLEAAERVAAETA